MRSRHALRLTVITSTIRCGVEVSHGDIEARFRVPNCVAPVLDGSDDAVSDDLTIDLGIIWSRRMRRNPRSAAVHAIASPIPADAPVTSHVVPSIFIARL